MNFTREYVRKRKIDGEKENEYIFKSEYPRKSTLENKLPNIIRTSTGTTTRQTIESSYTAIIILGATVFFLLLIILILLKKIKTSQRTFSESVDANCEICGKRSLETQTKQAKVDQRQGMIRKKHFGRVVLPASPVPLNFDQVLPSSYEGSGEYVDPNDPYINQNDPEAGSNDLDTKPKYLELVAELHNTSTEFSCRHLRMPICKCSGSGYYNVQCKTCQRKKKYRPKYDEINY